MIKVVIFDLDDTLISEQAYIKSGYRHVANVVSERYGLDAQKAYEDLLTLFNKSPKNVFNRLLDAHHIQYHDEDILKLVSAYRGHNPSISFYPDVTPALALLKCRDIKTAIITDGYVSTQRNKLEAVGAFALFDKIIITDELGRAYWKPHPKSFELIQEYFQVRFDEMLYVADNPEKDFYITQIHPIKTVRIMRKDSIYRDRDYLGGVHEDFSISVLTEIETLL